MFGSDRPAFFQTASYPNIYPLTSGGNRTRIVPVWGNHAGHFGGPIGPDIGDPRPASYAWFRASLRKCKQGFQNVFCSRGERSKTTRFAPWPSAQGFRGPEVRIPSNSDRSVEEMHEATRGIPRSPRKATEHPPKALGIDARSASDRWISVSS